MKDKMLRAGTVVFLTRHVPGQTSGTSFVTGDRATIVGVSNHGTLKRPDYRYNVRSYTGAAGQGQGVVAFNVTSDQMSLDDPLAGTRRLYDHPLTGAGSPSPRNVHSSASKPGESLYLVRFVHKISPKDTDVQQSLLKDKAVSSGNKLALAKELRAKRVLGEGQRIREMRAEGDRMIVFPSSGVWWSISIQPVAVGGGAAGFGPQSSGMTKVASEAYAQKLARDNNLLYGFSTFSSGWFVGTSEQLKAIGVVTPMVPPSPVAAAPKLSREDEKHQKYRVARAEAQRLANELGFDYGLEYNDVFKEWSFKMLPRRESRTGHELRVEVVHPEGKTQPGHGYGPLPR